LAQFNICSLDKHTTKKSITEIPHALRAHAGKSHSEYFDHKGTYPPSCMHAITRLTSVQDT